MQSTSLPHLPGLPPLTRSPSLSRQVLKLPSQLLSSSWQAAEHKGHLLSLFPIHGLISLPENNTFSRTLSEDWILSPALGFSSSPLLDFLTGTKHAFCLMHLFVSLPQKQEQSLTIWAMPRLVRMYRAWINP